ncbi:GNAT family N-acetyltransferase [Streptomyces sp. BE147]|uniref:GNAT family N-acetyltransferase n=1 Tax=unclassified Streptomyces TaxID=2593676 RepID=UPI002E7911B2|nr:GNAT family N-acetyltransferase [Streptomyces sp. BE147]MEE1738984.1 GNAT family N-acetyltransferase [Streptomyces sp. BE147]
MFRLETEVDRERRNLLNGRLRDDNRAASPELRALLTTPAEHEVPLEVWALDEQGGIVGGLTGRTWAYWLHVELLWVEATHRGLGLGSLLLTEAERVARTERDCTASRVETWDFQAPGFYRSHGYEEAGRVDDYPPGVTEFLLVKRLGRDGGHPPTVRR